MTEINIYVKAIDTSPHYEFYTDSLGTTELTPTNTLYTNNTYIFNRLNNEDSHPFFISDVGYEQESTSAITITTYPISSGSNDYSNGIKNNDLLKLEFNTLTSSDTLYYYCTSHSSMVSTFVLIDPPAAAIFNSYVNVNDNLIVTGNITLDGDISGSGASLYDIPNSGLENNSITINSQNVALGESVTLIASQWTTDSNAIYYDGGNVGIQTSDPSYALDVSGSVNCSELLVNGTAPSFSGGSGSSYVQLDSTYVTSSETYANPSQNTISLETNNWNLDFSNNIYYNTGNVGIGVDTANFELDVSGSVNCVELLVNGTAPTFGGEYVLYDDTYQTNALDYREVSANITTSSSGVWDLSDSNTISYINGNVGIGTTDPAYELDVSGDIYANNYFLQNNINIESTIEEIVYNINISSPSYAWDFRNNTGTSDVPDIINGQNAILYGGAYSTSEGMVFDGTDDYIKLDSWETGGEAFSVEAYVKYDSFNTWSRIFDFGNGDGTDGTNSGGLNNIFLANNSDSSGVAFTIRTEEAGVGDIRDGFWDISSWQHIVVTVDEYNFGRVYKNGTLDSSATLTEPEILTRTNHYIGKSGWSHDEYFDGTIAYFRWWNGHELSEDEVTTLYDNRENITDERLNFNIDNETVLAISKTYVGIGTTSPSELLTIQSASATDATFSVITQEESYNAIIYLGTPHNSGRAIKCAIIAEGRSNWSTSNLHFCLNNDTGGGTNDSSYSATLSDSRMVITPAGYVGIGTTSPIVPLHVAGISAHNLTHDYGRSYYRYDGFATQSTTYQTGNVTIYAEKCVVTSDAFISITGVATSSDERIKNNIIDLEDGACLEQLNLLKPKRYSYKDVVNRGSDSVVGFIAQEVQEIIPSAVQVMSQYIPNIYCLATVNGSILEFASPLDLTVITNGGKIKIYDIQDREHFIDVSSASTTTITLSDSSQITEDMLDENQIFVYGEEVHDFHLLKKEMIIPVAVGAIQELDRQLIQLKQEKDALQVSHDSLQASHDSLQASHDSLKNELDELKALLQEKSVI